MNPLILNCIGDAIIFAFVMLFNHRAVIDNQLHYFCPLCPDVYHGSRGFTRSCS